jgi:glycine dehydrogenase subunit 1
MSYVQNTDSDRQEMLKETGVSSFEELLEPIEEKLRLSEPLDIGPAMSEAEVAARLGALAGANSPASDMVSFLGGGIYDRYIPATVRYVLSRSEFYTSYTPYQAEVSQGTLQAIYEYQTMIARLTAMDAANASMYDASTALAEAMIMAAAIKRTPRIIVPASLSRRVRAVLDSYAAGKEIKIEEAPFGKDGLIDTAALEKLLADKAAAFVLAQPNYFGLIEDARAVSGLVHEAGALLVVLADPVSLALIEPPGAYDADIVVGEGQSLGIAQSFGGPLLGFLAAKTPYLRKCPGRLISATVDIEGKRGYTMTLQTREQHIRREKATSNICTNEGLVALAASVYLATLGEEGFTEVARQSASKARTLYGMLREAGVGLPFGENFFQEFVIDVPGGAEAFIARARERGVLAGIPLGMEFPTLGDGAVLVAVTEKRTREDLELLCGLASGKGGAV